MTRLLTPQDLAERWQVPVTWIYEQVRSRAADPLPHTRLGKYIRFADSPELEEWLQRREK
jgi:hypothetical protein